MRGESAPEAPVIRIVLAEVPGLIADLVKEVVLAQADMRIVAEVPTANALERAAKSGGIDVVVTATASEHLPMSYQHLVFSASRIPVLAISGDGRRVDVYDRQIVREVSPQQLVEMIRNVAEGRARSLGH
jgi:hypothetical protein